jgi:hypothetical protein
VLSYYTKSGLYLIDDLEPTLFLLEQVKQFPTFENRVVIVSHKGVTWNNRVLAIQLKRGCLCYANSASDVSAVDIYHGFTYWEHMEEIPKPTFTKQGYSHDCY